MKQYQLLLAAPEDRIDECNPVYNDIMGYGADIEAFTPGSNCLDEQSGTYYSLVASYYTEDQVDSLTTQLTQRGAYVVHMATWDGSRWKRSLSPVEALASVGLARQTIDVMT